MDAKIAVSRTSPLGDAPDVGKCAYLLGNTPGSSDNVMDTAYDGDGADVRQNKRRKRGRQAKSCVACHRRKQKVRGVICIFHRNLGIRNKFETL